MVGFLAWNAETGNIIFVPGLCLPVLDHKCRHKLLGDVMAKDESASFDRGSVRQSVCLGDALELAKTAQISGVGYREIAREIAGPFWQQISAIFRGHYLAVYLLTDHSRRSVWHAVLSAGQADPVDLRWDAIAQQELLARFLHDGSEELITGAFGSCPTSYLSVLKRFAAKAERDVAVFNRLHQLLTDHPHLGPQLCNQGRVSGRLVALLAMLPAPLKHLRVAELFDGDPRVFDGFMSTYAALTGRHELTPADMTCILRGEKPGSILQRIFHAIPFPAPFLPNTDRIKHLHNGEAMVSAASRYSNCLRNWIGEAHHNHAQYYRVVLADGSMAVLALKQDAPAGWLLDEVKLAHNADPEDALQDELREYLSQFGVRVGPPLESRLRRFARPSLVEAEADLFGLDADLLEFLGDVN